MEITKQRKRNPRIKKKYNKYFKKSDCVSISNTKKPCWYSSVNWQYNSLYN